MGADLASNPRNRTTMPKPLKLFLALLALLAQASATCMMPALGRSQAGGVAIFGLQIGWGSQVIERRIHLR
ncbi:hypothetical protein PGQ11_014695 [Apiospora arundinis]|uniref:Uncharacterized protein n=1 Tax=Apiospora arundinis TaxID=335852 RepID=A0ABR2HSZ8_9PEZI